MMRQYARLSACQAQRDRLCSGSCISHCAAVAELVDATDSKSVSGDRVGVRFPSAAPLFISCICDCYLASVCSSPAGFGIDGESPMDTCPPFHNFLKPMLMLAATGEINVRNSADAIADDFGLSPRARLEATRSGNQRRFIDRTHWAATYLRQAGLLKTTRRGYVEITDEGVKFNSKFEKAISKRIFSACLLL